MLDSEHNRRIAELRRPLQEEKSGQEEKGEKEKEEKEENEENEEEEEEEEEVSAPWLTPQGPGGPSLYVCRAARVDCSIIILRLED